MGAGLGLAQVEARASQNYLVAMGHVVFEQLLEIQRLGTALDDGDGVDAEAELQHRVREQLVENDLVLGVALQLDDNAQSVAP